jgi:acyl carrier protein
MEREVVTLNRGEILERLRTVLPDRVGVDPLSLEPDALLAEIGIDSYSLIELVFLAEEEFKVTIPMDGIKATTVGDVLDIIYRRIALNPV